MNTDEKNGFGVLMWSIAELYGKKLSPELLEIYWRTLEEYPFDEVSRALNTHVLNPDSGQFMPKPADVARYIHGETHAQALRAWSKVRSAIRAVGAYESIVFDDAIIHIVIEEMQGWIGLCQTKEEKLPFVASEFQKRYAAHLSHKPAVYPKQLIGMFQHQCISTNHKFNELLLFGDENLARNIYETGSDLTLIKQVHELTKVNNTEEKSNDKQQFTALTHARRLTSAQD
jgi:hypothetical protein